MRRVNDEAAMTYNTKLVSEARPISPPRDHADEPLTVEPITITGRSR